jgi:hypothetical protein
MNNLSLILSAIFTLALVVIIAPNIMAMNRGKVLRNIAIWLAVFAGLGLFYQTFGPGSKNQMFSMPDALRLNKAHPTLTGQPDTNEPATNGQGFTPPKED